MYLPYLSQPVVFSVYNLSNSIVDSISKLVKNFLWAKGDNCSSIHSVGWNITMLDKVEGGLGIRDLRIDKTSLMAKHVLSFLNANDKLWVDIMRIKYGHYNSWEYYMPPK